MSECSDPVLYKREGAVAIITLNRPDQLNALTGPMMDQLAASTHAAADDPEVRAVLIRGAGRAFCAGGDFKAGPDAPEVLGRLCQEDRAAMLRRRMEVANLLHTMRKPTISVLRGATMGAGVGLGLAADIRLASPTLQLNTAFAGLAFSGDFGGSYFLTLWAGAAIARELMMTPRKVDAEEALRLRLISRLIPDEDLDREALVVAAELAAGPTIAYQLMKRSLNAAAAGASCATVLDLEAESMIRSSLTADHQEAVRAFLGRRPARFEGR